MSVEIAKSKDLEWLNSLCWRFWPHIDKAMQKIIHDMVTPLIQRHMPYLLSGIYFKEFSLGKRPVNIGPLKVFEGEDSFRVRVALDYHSDEDIELGIGLASFGLSNLNVSGELVLCFEQLLDEVPVVGGLTFYFLDPLKLSYDFNGLAYDGLRFVPGVGRLIRDAIEDAVNWLFVLPSQWNFALGTEEQGVDVSLMKLARPIGVLQVAATSARNLKGNDWSLSGWTCDPFVEVKMGAQSWKSSAVKSSSNPVWKGESGTLLVYDREQTIWITVWDDDKLDSHDIVGVAEGLPLEKAMKKNGFPVRLFSKRLGLEQRAAADARTDRHPDEDRRGELVMSIIFHELVPMTEAVLRNPKCILQVKVDEINLPRSLGEEVKVICKIANTLVQETPTGYAVAPQPIKTVSKVMADVVRKLHDKGMASQDIAEVTQLHVQEVEFCLKGGEVAHRSKSQTQPIPVEAMIYLAFGTELLEHAPLEISLADSSGNVFATKVLPLAAVYQNQRAREMGRGDNQIMQVPVVHRDYQGSPVDAQIVLSLLGTQVKEVETKANKRMSLQPVADAEIVADGKGGGNGKSKGKGKVKGKGP